VADAERPAHPAPPTAALPTAGELARIDRAARAFLAALDRRHGKHPGDVVVLTVPGAADRGVADALAELRAAVALASASADA
jgi:hypothetical protein